MPQLSPDARAALDWLMSDAALDLPVGDARRYVCDTWGDAVDAELSDAFRR